MALQSLERMDQVELTQCPKDSCWACHRIDMRGSKLPVQHKHFSLNAEDGGASQVLDVSLTRNMVAEISGGQSPQVSVVSTVLFITFDTQQIRSRKKEIQNSLAGNLGLSLFCHTQIALYPLSPSSRRYQLPTGLNSSLVCLHIPRVCKLSLPNGLAG